MKPRVAIVIPHFGNGGAENMVSRLASHLDLNKVCAEVICLYGNPLNNRLEKEITDHGIEIKYIGKGKGFSLKAIRSLAKELNSFKPTVIHTHLSACVYCASWVMFHKVKILHTIHNIPKNELIRPKRLVMHLLYKLKKAVPVAISHEIQTMMVSAYKLKSLPELIYNPVDIARYNIPRIDHSGINLVTAGRLTPQKNQALLIDTVEKIVKEHPDVSLTVLGDGQLRNQLEEQVKKLSLNNSVRFMGNVSNVENYFSESDIFVLSSDYEGLPLVILEAMAAGLPIVSTNVGGIKDIVTDNGVLVAPNDSEALYCAIKDLINNKDYRLELGIKSKNNVAKFDSSIIADLYTDLYEKYSVV